MATSSPRSKSLSRRTGNDRSARSSSQAEWAVLFYLAGDLKPDLKLDLRSDAERDAKPPLEPLAQSINEDLMEILQAGASPEVRVAVQHDHPVRGAARYLLPSHPRRTAKPSIPLGNVDSGNYEVLADFLRWGLSECPANRIALVLGGFAALDPGYVKGKHNQRVFTICRDDTSGGYLDVIELGSVIRQVMSEFGRAKLELLAIDSCQTQFVELAYELEDRVEVLLAPQMWVPDCGWDYTKVLQTWKEAARLQQAELDTASLAKKLIPVIIEAYREGKAVDRDEAITANYPFVVSALDLRRLDDVARAFDTLCIGMLQVLGEGLIWEARELVLSLVKDDSSEAIDCGSLFEVLAATLEAMADESTQGWLGCALERSSGAEAERFRTVAAESLSQCVRGKKDLRAATLEALANKSVQESLGVEGRSVAEIPDEWIVRKEDLARLRKWGVALRGKKRDQKPLGAGTQLLKQIGEGIRDRVSDHSDQKDWMGARVRAKIVDFWLDGALTKAWDLLPEARQREYERQKEAAASALRLARQSRLCSSMLFGKNASQDAFLEARDGLGMVVAAASTDEVLPSWPRWSGVSLYRPTELDALMNPSYQGLRFHQRIHWAALVGAGSLIESHPRALWRLVSSLLATGSAGTRRDLLQRLTGSDSVVWGLRYQFQVLAPAPTLTLSLEQRRRSRSSVASNKADSNATNEERSRGLTYSVSNASKILDSNATKEEPPSKRENFLLRLESASSGAVIIEQLSRVQPRVMDRALRELDKLLEAPTTTEDSLNRLRAIGGLLGDDIFQTLGKSLEEERQKALKESAGLAPHLQLQIPKKLMGYPWELIHHNGEWLSEQFAIGRQVFMETGMARRVSRRSRGRVRPLIVGDPVLDTDVLELNWRQLPSARDEADEVARWFEQLRRELGEMIDFQRERDTRIHTRLTNQDFRELLRGGDYDIIHFAGHGVFHPKDTETSAWMLSDGELWALEIRNTLANHPAPPWLVYANACDAGMESRTGPRKYQSNVSGLATAFLTQGVAAYVAPLWPIDDLLARLIALDFYRNLLSERVTLGESLRRAKSSARREAYPDSATESDKGAWASLGWASLVLYGDPTEELFRALAGSETKSQRSEDRNLRTPVPTQVSPRTDDSPIRHGRQFVHAPDRLLAEWVAGPQRHAAGAEYTRRGADSDDPVTLELIEEAGLRRWRMPSSGPATRGQGSVPPAHSDGLPGSPFAELLADERLQAALPARRGRIRVIWRWTKSGFSGGTLGLVKEYDQDKVPKEGLVWIGLNELRPWTTEDRSVLLHKADLAPRALLVIHGTISKTESPVNGLGNKFLDWARERYEILLGFDHWTLSKTPLENAQMLAEQLQLMAPELLASRRLDIITHSRGGLVARAFCELLPHADAVRNLIFLGTPNCGTDLANSKNWGRMADTLVNFSGMKHAEPIGYLAGLLARLAAMGVQQQIPGLLAQNPEMAGVKGQFLYELQQSKAESNGIRYSVITADFEPTPLVPNLKALWSTAKKMGIDAAADKFIQDGNDLVVNTSHVWCLDQTPAKKQSLPKLLGRRVLAFVPPDTSVDLPAGVRREIALGVDHFNLFSQTRAQECMKEWLRET